MATRFYLPTGVGTDLAPLQYNLSATHWNNNTAANGSHIHNLTLTKTGTALTDRTVSETVASAVNQNFKAYLSPPLAAQTISGTFSAVLRGRESATSGDNSLQIVIRVLSGDVATERAVSYAGHTATLNATVGALGEEFQITTLATRIFNAVGLSSYTCVSGDRLSVEIGHRSHDTSATSDSSTINFGDPIGTGDYALTSGLTTTLCPWVEFSGTISFLPPRLPTTVRQAVNRSSVY